MQYIVPFAPLMIMVPVILMYLAMNNSCNFWSKVNVKVKSFAQQQFGATISPFSSTPEFIDPL